MHLLTLLHRWLGIFFCLLFAMWFASGIVMHFVPFPALTDAERFEGLAPIDAFRVSRSVADAIRATAISDVTRVRLIERADGPVYIIAGISGLAALHADNLSSAKVDSEHLAVSIAADHAHRRHIDETEAGGAELALYDQWTVPNDLDRHRPLYRISLNDPAQTEVYVSSTTGEVVRDTTLHERWWNYVGSVAHWIYPSILRSRPRAWEATVWTLSLIALIAAISGSLVGTLRIRMKHYRLVSPYHGWQAWHHILGLACMTFVLTWIFSGWLSLDNGRLFSTGRFNVTPNASQSMDPHWGTLPMPGQGEISPQAREVEWFLYWGRLYGRERTSHINQHLWSVERTNSPAPRREYLQSHEINVVARHIAPACD